MDANPLLFLPAAVICDECHFIKDPGAQRTKATVPVIKEARRAILLSGTPALNKPKELFQQVQLLMAWASRWWDDHPGCLHRKFASSGVCSQLPCACVPHAAGGAGASG